MTSRESNITWTQNRLEVEQDECAIIAFRVALNSSELWYLNENRYRITTMTKAILSDHQSGEQELA
jgi:hypothetical protein